MLRRRARSTALHLAASFGSLDALEVLVDAGANLESQVNGAEAADLQPSRTRIASSSACSKQVQMQMQSKKMVPRHYLRHRPQGMHSSWIRCSRRMQIPTVALSPALPSAALKNHTEVGAAATGGADPNALETDGATACCAAAAGTCAASSCYSRPMPTPTSV